MSSDDDFSALVGDDVRPLNIDQRVRLNKDDSDTASFIQRRMAAESEQEQALDPLASSPMQMLEPLSLLEFKRPGVQNGVYRNMRLGKYRIDARIDLHRKTIEQARPEVYQFIKDCVANDVRMALITHGKGEGREQPALLKSHVAYWLPQIDDVLAFHTAQKQHGGYGATYILVRKSDKKKDETRRKMGQRE